MTGLLDELARDEAQRLRPASDDPGTAMLATLTDRREFGGGWIVSALFNGGYVNCNGKHFHVPSPPSSRWRRSPCRSSPSGGQ